MANYRIIILCMILWFFHSANTPVTCSNNKTDLLALLSFKAAIYDDPRGALNSWNETVHFCSWKGILCGSRHRTRVVSINLMSQGLVGSISPHRLEYIEFSNNSFDGSIPRNLSQCRNLYYLNLIDNDLTGIIPPELGSLLELEALGLSENKLLGTISPFIGNLTRLVLLSLANCGLQGEVPQALVHLQSLELLNLDENSLTGSIPSGLYNISTFSIFTVRSNQLRGTIPSDLGFKFPKLRHLDLGDNLFSGVIPVSIVKCFHA
ncbi:LRR receptor-like serine/threonine-protein kinase GSO1 [Forsythia ovata]|uniref:LRR receptor-like serine/threonine-protein kinase GSO1 n=1 Tax=Forsythia ovata TaxID=205694 RepID=A0ABD1PUK4_9LAMI